MVKKLFKILYNEITGLHEAAFLLGVFALLSQILGLVRDRMLASTFGASSSLDIYYSAFRIPDFIFATVASLVSVFVLVPFITDRLDKNIIDAKRFIGSIFSYFGVLMIIVSAIAFFLIPVFSPIIFKGLDGKDAHDLIVMTRILLLSPFFLGISNFFASITQIGKRFLVYALCPILYNVGLLIGIIYFYPVFGIYGLSYGVVLGAILHFAVQIPFVIKTNLFQWRYFNLEIKSFLEVIKVSIPRTLASSMSQLSILGLIALASLMEEGSISIFNFAYNLEAVPLSIIGVSYATVAFPALSNFFAKGEKDKYVASIVNGARHIIFWSVPISILFIVLRAQIVRVIYGAGQFDWNSTRLTAATLAVFIVSVVAQSLILIFVRAFYAAGETKKALFSNVFSLIATLGLSYWFTILFNSNLFFRNFIESILRVSGIEGTSVLMLALGFSLASIINCALLWWIFSRTYASVSKPLLRTLFETFCASIIMGAISYLFLNIFDNFFDLDTFWGIFAQGFLSGIIGILCLIVMLYILKSREFMEISSTLHKKFWRTSVLPAETTEL